MNTRDHEPLTPEERDLAQRLSRLGGHAAPSASLDARILAAAQAAVAARARRRPRWPFGVGIAASLAVALGIAWQLRPQPERAVLPAASEEASQYDAMVLEAPKPAGAPAPPVSNEGKSDAADTGAAIEAPADAAPALAARALPVPPPPEPAPAAEALPATEAPIVFDEPALKRAAATADAERRQREDALFDVAAPAASAPPAPPPPPPPPPSMAPAPAPESRGFAASPPPATTATAIGASTQVARERKAGAQSAAAAADAGATLDSIVVTGTRIERADRLESEASIDQPLDDRPPASADAPEVRDAWLKRIRELRAAGQLDDARASLREFVRRHPGTAVPDDLRPLLGE